MLSVVAVLLVTASACTKQPAGEQGAVVDVRTAIEGGTADTKTIVTGTDFPSWNGRADEPAGTFGIFSCVGHLRHLLLRARGRAVRICRPQACDL